MPVPNSLSTTCAGEVFVAFENDEQPEAKADGNGEVDQPERGEVKEVAEWGVERSELETHDERCNGEHYTVGGETNGA